MTPIPRMQALPFAFALGVGAAPMAALAQAAPPAMPDPAGAPTVPQDEAAEGRGDEDIVVTAPTMQRGAARVPAEATIDAAEIEAHAADDIAGLLASLAPRTGGEQPIFLINGERVEGGGGIGMYPPEAIERIDILPPRAALAYGYPPGQPLLNIVLKLDFRSLVGQMDGGAATQGGGGTYSAQASHVAIAGKSRWSAQLRAKQSDMLLESQRDIPPAPSGVKGEGSGRYRSIAPASRSLNMTLDRAAGLGRFQSILQFAANYSESRSLLGTWLAGMAAPEGGPPFGVGTANDLTPDGRAILHGSARSGGASTALNLSGAVGGWQLNTIAQYAFSESRSRVDRAIAALSDPGTPGSGAANEIGRDDSRTVSHNILAQLIASRSLARLPAGSARLNLQLGATASRAVTSTADAPTFRSARRNASGRIAFTLPINSAAEGPLDRIGDLSLNVSGGGDVGRGEAARTQFEYGIGWAPVRGVNLSASIGRSSAPPSPDLLAAPLVETPNVRIFDFVSGERVDAVIVTGGNSDLLAARTSTLDLRLALYPAFAKGLSLQSAFRSAVVRDGVGSFPALTLAVEDAFPDRIVRDDRGRILRVDRRPINMARSSNETLTTNFGWQVELGGGIPAADEAVPDDELPALPRRMSAGRRKSLSLGLSHVWALADEQLLREGVPVLDRLTGMGGTGTPRHRLSAKALVNLGGIGTDVDIRWASPTVARSAGRDGQPGTSLHFSARTQIDVRLFGSPARLAADAAGKPWAKGLRLGVDIENLLDQRLSVVDQNGEVPAGFTRDEVDPLGRTFRFSVRKLF